MLGLRRRKRSGGRRFQRGYLMAGLMAAIAVMGIFSALALQEWAELLRRDNEAEMIFRGRDIARAIVRFRRDHGGQSPTELKQLMEPGPRGQYYLRQIWKDPLVADGKWGLLYVGPGGEIIDPAQQSQGGVPLGSGLPGGAGSIGGIGNSGSLLNPAGGAAAQPGTPGAATVGGGTAGSTGSLLNPDGGGTGLPIAGVRSLSDDEPFRVLNGLSDYSQWQFTYQEYEGAGAAPGQQRQRGPGRLNLNEDGPRSKGIPGTRGNR